MKVTVEVKGLRKVFGRGRKAVNAVKIGPKLVDVYIIEEKAFYHFNFILI